MRDLHPSGEEWGCRSHLACSDQKRGSLFSPPCGDTCLGLTGEAPFSADEASLLSLWIAFLNGWSCSGRVLALQFIPFLLIFLVTTFVTARKNIFLVPRSVCPECQVQTCHSWAGMEAAHMLHPSGLLMPWWVHGWAVVTGTAPFAVWVWLLNPAVCREGPASMQWSVFVGSSWDSSSFFIWCLCQMLFNDFCRLAWMTRVSLCHTLCSPGSHCGQMLSCKQK